MPKKNFFSKSEIRYLKITTLNEIEDLLKQLNTVLEQFSNSEIGTEPILSEIYSIFHTIKGSAFLGSLRSIGKCGEKYEKEVKKYSNKKAIISKKEFIDLIKKGIKEIDKIYQKEKEKLEN